MRRRAAAALEVASGDGQRVLRWRTLPDSVTALALGAAAIRQGEAIPLGRDVARTPVVVDEHGRIVRTIRC